MKKEKPILFSTPMVNAILEGRKKMTRRVIKFSGDDPKLKCLGSIIGDEKHNGKFGFGYTDERILFIIKPKYNVGDILWVRETFLKYNDPDTGIKFLYKATPTILSESNNIKWMPSIFMPKEAARIFLEVTNVRVERLQEITEEDSIAEGAKYMNDSISENGETYKGSYKNGFKHIWESINGASSWDENPFVFVYAFKPVEL